MGITAKGANLISLPDKESFDQTRGVSMDRITVTITIDDKRVTLEGPEAFVREEVERFASLRPNVIPIVGVGDIPSSEGAFYAGKRPQNQSETVAVFGYWLTEHGNPEFTDDDIKRAYIRAGVRPPKVIAQALRDAKNKFDYLESGAKRGSFRLSDHGDRTVRFDLPRKE